MGSQAFGTGGGDPSSGPSGHLLPRCGEKWKKDGATFDVWAAMLRWAVAMGLRPEDFWRLSWREWRMLNDVEAPAVLDRAGFEALMEEFPDR